MQEIVAVTGVSHFPGQVGQDRAFGGRSAQDALVSAERMASGGKLKLDFSSVYSQLGYVMITSTISETKDKLSELLTLVRGGETLIILDRKRPVARVEAIKDVEGNPHVLPARSKWNPKAVLRAPLAGLVDESQTLARAVAEERESQW